MTKRKTRTVATDTVLRVLAVTPTYGDGPAAEMRAAFDALEPVEGIEVEWWVLDDNPYKAPDHRNVLHMYRQAQRRALDEGFHVLWTVEHDIVLQPNALRELAKTPGDIVYGVYLFRWGTYVLNVLEHVGGKNIGESLSLFPKKLAMARKAGVVKCSGVGWGCTWIRRRALEAIELPAECTENPAYDVAYAQRALRAGMDMRANMAVACGHMKDGTLLAPFADLEIKYNGAAVMVGGQLMPMFKVVSRGTTHVRAMQTLFIEYFGQSMKLKKGLVYELDPDTAHELGRAGYVQKVVV